MNQDSAKAATLRSKIDVHRPAVAMAAHNSLAAKLAAGAGFDAIWGSGFELSASYAVPDASILSMDIHLETMRAIGEVQDAPVIASPLRQSLYVRRKGRRVCGSDEGATSPQSAPSWGAPYIAADCTPHGFLCTPAEPALILTTANRAERGQEAVEAGGCRDQGRCTRRFCVYQGYVMTAIGIDLERHGRISQEDYGWSSVLPSGPAQPDLPLAEVYGPANSRSRKEGWSYTPTRPQTSAQLIRATRCRFGPTTSRSVSPTSPNGLAHLRHERRH